MPIRSRASGRGPTARGDTVLRAAKRAPPAGRSTTPRRPSLDLTGMGTTLTAILFDLRGDAGGPNRAHLVHVGDSRAYLLRGNHISQLSDDPLLDRRAGPRRHADRGRGRRNRSSSTSSRARLGFEREVDVDLVRVPVQSGDQFVLCTDGLSNYVGPDEIARVLNEHGAAETPSRLVALANKRGGDDNITVLVVKIA